MIEFKNFSAYYKVKREYVQALDDLSFTIQRGELFVVVGESGCGKTTLLKSILGKAEYVKGELEVDGIQMDDLLVKNCNFAMVRQQIALYPSMTVYENIAFPLRIMHTPQEEVDRRVKKVAEVMDIGFLLSRKPRQLSIGQQQRVSIARAMIKNPDLVLFDEPFSNLDPAMRRELRDYVMNVHRLYKTTMVFVTHDLQEAFAIADRILVLREGRIDALGTPEQLRKNPQSELLEVFFKL